MGTPNYSAPEQRHDPHLVDARADVYGIAATALSILIGRPPSSDPHDRTVQFVGLPIRMQEVLRRGLAEQPEQRQPSPAIFYRELSAAHQAVTVSPGAPPNEAGRATRVNRVPPTTMS